MPLMRHCLLISFLILCLSRSWAQDPFHLPAGMETALTPFALQFTEASQLAAQLQAKQSHLLSPSATLLADDRTNTLWIEDRRDHLAKLRRIIQQLDQPSPQILIRAKIMLLDDHAERVLGNKLAIHATIQPLKPLLSLRDMQSLSGELGFLEQHGHAKTIAMPELITNNRQTASIESGDELPYQEKTGEGNTSIAFKKAVLALKVTPILLPQHAVLLKLSVSQNKPSALMVQGTPSIATQELKTQVVIPQHTTYLLGGITQLHEHQQQNGLPWLGRWLGPLFSQEQAEHSRQQLVIFITPEIV